LFIYLTPFIPLSFKGGGEEISERGEAPLSPTHPLPLMWSQWAIPTQLFCVVERVAISQAWCGLMRRICSTIMLESGR